MKNSFSRFALKLHEQFTGRHILARLEEMNRTQWLSRDQLMELQRNKLLDLVEYANQFVPYYRKVFKEVGFHPNDLQKDLASFSKIPILTKQIIRENLNDLLTTEPNRRRHLSKLSTSGSTGEPLIFMQDSDFRDSVTAGLQKHLSVAGWRLGDLHAVIWGYPRNSSISNKIRTALINQVWNRLHINAYAMTDEAMTDFARQIQHRKPLVLYGYATSIYQFAQFIRQCPNKEISFDGILSTSEILLPAVRKFIEETFHCEVIDRYGTTELGGIACECNAHTGMHLNMENNYVEILNQGSPSKFGEVGDIIVTNLDNLGMPFIRYSVGDEGSWVKFGDCPCGRSAPKLKAIEGRTKDTFLTLDGRKISTGFSGHAFECMANPGIRQFQVVQKTIDRIIIRLVTDQDIPQATLNEIKNAFYGMFGENISIEFEFPKEIQPLPSGKHQYAISEINKI